MKNTISVRYHVKLDEIKDLIDSASRGSAYWADSQNLGYESQVAIIFNHHAVEIVDNEDDKKLHRLNLEKVKKGLTVMAKKEPKHFADFIKQEYDQVTGDVFLQCCLFGKVIYG